MNSVAKYIRSAAVGLMIPLVLLSGCADQSESTMTFALAGDGDFFQLNIYEGAVNTEFDGTVLFDSGCIQRSASSSDTFSITNVPTSSNATIVFRYYSAATCDPASRVGLGYRGGVVIDEQDEQGYYHVSIIPESGSGMMPSEVNLSQSAMQKVSYCEVDSQCPSEYALGETTFEAAGGCYRTKSDNALTSEYWCAPICEQDSDCEVMHSNGVCDLATRWCMLPSTYPIGTSQGRAFGSIQASGDGDLFLIGGFATAASSPADGEVLSVGSRGAERFDIDTGLFASSGLDDEAALNVGLAGYDALEDGRVVAVGGSDTARITIGFDSSVGLADVEPSGDIAVVDFASGLVEVFEDAMEPSAASAVVALTDSISAGDYGFVVIGGLRENGDDVIPSSRVTYCQHDAGALSCSTVGSMSASRVMPAAQCIGDQCQLILVAGGNSGGAPFEVLDLSALTSSEQISMTASQPEGFLEPLRGAALCDNLLVGGVTTGGQGLEPQQLIPNPLTSEVIASPIDNSAGLVTSGHAAVIGPLDGDCWSFGGIDTDVQALTRILRVNGDGVSAVADTDELGAGRFAASAALIAQGPLAGTVMISGGLTVDQQGGVYVAEPAVGIDLFRP